MALTDEGRCAALSAAADEIEASSEALAQLIAREQGKPLSGPGARFEAGAVVGWLRATIATKLEPEVVVDDGQVYVLESAGVEAGAAGAVAEEVR